MIFLGEIFIMTPVLPWQECYFGGIILMGYCKEDVIPVR